MPFNGSGIFQRVRNWVADAAAGIKIRADYHDAEDDGFAAGLSNCITKDGQSIVTQNIPWNNKRITGLQDPVNAQDAATKAYVGTQFGLGGKMTGDLEIEKDGPTFTMDDTDAAGAHIIGQHMGKTRWIIHLLNADPESTGNKGSNFEIERFADDGTTSLGKVVTYNRETGLGVITGPPTDDLGIATKKYTDDALALKVTKAGDTMLGQLTSFGAGGGINTAPLSTSFNVYNTSGVQHAYMSFYAAGYFGANFGVAADGNFYMGGVSHGTNIYRFWTTRDFAAVPSSPVYVGNGRMILAAAHNHSGEGITEPFYGAVVTGAAGLGVTVLQYRYLQLFTTGWFTVGYA
jgi:hypothetical protein